ncbi:PEP-CTERM sorting domain-containing protein [Thalassotalea piscium]
MKFKFLKVASAALMLSLTLSCNIANAGLILFTNSGTVSSSEDSNITAGAIVNVGIYADDNGTGLYNGAWRASDLLNGYIEIGTYRLDIPDNWYGTSVIFSTDDTGTLKADVYGTDGGTRTDNYGTSSAAYVYGDWQFVNTLGQNTYTTVSATQGWSVAAVGVTQPVPEPTTLAIFALGMIGLASRRFKKQS